MKSFITSNEHVDLSSSDDVNIGDKCYAIGSTLRIQNTISDGIISNILSRDNDYFFQITNPISPGSSGGALFDEYGKFIGVTVESREDGQNINYAIPSKYIYSLLKRSYKPLTLIAFQNIVNKVIISEKVIPKENYSPLPETDEAESQEEDQSNDLGLTPIDYYINGSYIFNTSVLTSDFPDNVKIDKSFSVSFAYMINGYIGFGFLY